MVFRSMKARAAYLGYPEVKVAAAMADEVATCPPHHFRVESPHGGEFSEGWCVKCGVEQTFRNWTEGTAFSDERFPAP